MDVMFAIPYPRGKEKLVLVFHVLFLPFQNAVVQVPFRFAWSNATQGCRVPCDFFF